MYQVDSEDANFLFLENADSPTHISLVYLYDQSALGDSPVRFTHIREHIDHRLNSAPVFRQKVRRTPGDIDYPYWVDDDRFDLDFHVRHLALPKPGDWRQFCILTSRLHSRPLDMSRPLWELYVIEGLEQLKDMPPNCFALYFKVHHCAMDEFTALELFQSLHSSTPNPRQHESTAQHIAHLPSAAPPRLEMLVRGLLNNSVRSLRLLLQTANHLGTVSKITTRMAIRAARSLLEEEQSDTPRSRFAATLSASRVFQGNSYPRQLIEDYTALVPGASPTHAILAICGEATRRYLEAHGEMGEQSLNALLEVNVRNAGAHALVGNRIAINQVALHTSVIFPEGRLQAVYNAQRELHSVETAELTSFKLRSLYENVPAPLLAWLGRRANRRSSLNRTVMSGGNLGVAELQGSDRPLYLLGARLRAFTSILPLYSGCGLVFCASTYADNVGLTFTSDRHMMPDPGLMRKCLDDTMEALETYLAFRIKTPRRVTAAAKRKPRRKAGKTSAGRKKAAA